MVRGIVSVADMAWLRAAAVVVALAIAVEVAQWLLGPILRPLGRALRRLYTPPHGAAALIATWAAAVGAFWAAFTVGAERPGLGAALALGGPFAALVATLLYRDQRRESRGLPPVVTELSANIGQTGRVLLGAGAAASLILGILLSLAVGSSAWEAIAGLVALGGITGYVVWRASYPALFVDFLGARKRAMKAKCSFCGEREAAGRRIILGPGTLICQQCVSAAQHALESWRPGEPRGLYGNPPGNARRCSFCGESSGEVPGFVAVGIHGICGPCIAVTEEMFADMADESLTP